MGLPYLPEALTQVGYSLPYLDSTLGLVVKDELRDEFASLDEIGKRGRLTIGLTVDPPGIEDRLREQLPGVDLRFESLSSPRLLRGQRPDIDALAMLAESGAAWSILHPAYSVVVPQPRPLHWPVGVGMRRGDRDLAEFVDDWLVIAQRRRHPGARLLGARQRR